MDAGTYFKRGVAKICLEDYKGAIDDFTKTLIINPEYPDAYFFRGRANYYLQEYNIAITDFTKAIEINPKKAEAYLERSFAKGEIKDDEGAKTDLSKALEVDPRYEVVTCVTMDPSQVFFGEIDDYNKAIEINPKYAEAYYVRGLAKIKLNQKDSGCSDLKKAEELGIKDASEQIKKFCQ